jgi:hypothetical protein
MSWAIRQGHEHNHVDGRTHVHHIHLFNQVTGGEHNIDLLLGTPMCPNCKRPFAQDGLGHLNPAAEIEAALEALQGNHAAIMEYVQIYRVPVLLGPLAAIVPPEHKLLSVGAHKFLHPEAKK